MPTIDDLLGEAHAQKLDKIYEKLSSQDRDYLMGTIETLANSVLIDPLTGCYNKRAFNRDIETVISKAKRNNEELSLLMIDIDYFKKINDAYGHVTGDRVLQLVVEYMKKGQRRHEQLYRYGGEEFAVILPEVKMQNAIIAGERLRKSVEEGFKLPCDGRVIPCTISVGVAPYASMYGAPDFISVADKALYQAKEKGRNQVFIFNQE
jgi:diguanylate cyclase (GGDEF)-like protein